MTKKISFLFANGVYVEIRERPTIKNVLVLVAYQKNKLIFENLNLNPNSLTQELHKLEVRASIESALELDC